MDIEKQKNELMQVVTWYKKLKKDYSNIEDLMYARKRITTIQFMLSVELGNLRQQWKEAEIQTEIVRRSKAFELIQENCAMTKVQEISRYESIPQLEMERLADAEYNALKFMIDATQEVGNSMMQHISQLKLEKSNIVSHT
jgi:hypothetical protein